VTTLDMGTEQNETTNKEDGTNTPSNVVSLKTERKTHKNTPKKLTLAGIDKLATKFNEKRTVYICDGQYEVIINENFRATEINKISVDFLKIIQNLRSMKGIDDETIMSAASLIDTLVLKYFTNLPIPSDLSNVAKLIKVSNNLIDLGITSELLGEGKNSFTKSNMELVRKLVDQSLEKMGAALGELGIISELDDHNRIDVDDYFSELALRDFAITEDEDLGVLLKVIDQMHLDDTYDLYMSKLTEEETLKVQERLNIIEESQLGK
jgi:hypothetical protein